MTIMWNNMTVEQRAQAIHTGMLDGLGGTGIAKRLGTTRSAVRAVAWRWNLTPTNLSTWTFGQKRHVVQQHRDYPPRKRKHKTMAEKRSSLPNNAIDDRTRQAVEIINALPFKDDDIAVELGNSAKTIRHWRAGRNGITEFTLQCVQDLPERMGVKYAVS